MGTGLAQGRTISGPCDPAMDWDGDRMRGGTELTHVQPLDLNVAQRPVPAPDAACCAIGGPIRFAGNEQYDPPGPGLGMWGKRAPLDLQVFEDVHL